MPVNQSDSQSHVRLNNLGVILLFSSDISKSRRRSAQYTVLHKYKLYYS